MIKIIIIIMITMMMMMTLIVPVLEFRALYNCE